MKVEVLKDYLGNKSGLMHKAGEIINLEPCGKFAKSLIANKFVKVIEDKPKTVWDLKFGDTCYIRRLYDEKVYIHKVPWVGNATQCLEREYNAVYLTMEDAEAACKRDRAEAILRGDMKGYKPAPSDKFSFRWYVEYDLELSQLAASPYCTLVQCPIVFKTKEDAVASINKHHQEWLDYFGIGNGQ